MEMDFSDLILNKISPQSGFEESVLEFVKEWFSDSKTVSVQTSGSTGKPKIFEIEKEKMRNSAKMTCDFLGLKEGDSALLCLPIEYISGKMMVVRAIERKLKLFVKSPSAKPLEELAHQIDFCAITPLQAENSLDKMHLIKKIIIGGAAVSESLKKKIFEELNGEPRTESQDVRAENREPRTKSADVRIESQEPRPFSKDFGGKNPCEHTHRTQGLIPNSQPPTANRQPPTTIFETYGMSETLSHIALKQIFPVSEDYFTVLDEVKISADERGCLRIFAPTINSEILQTNDLAELKNEKQFRFLGRIDNVINSGGAKIFPEELEALIKKEIPNEVVLLGIPDEVLGEKLILIIEGKENETIKHQLSLINYKKSFLKPKEIIFVEKIPRTPNGKVSRNGLKSLISKSLYF